MAESYLKQTLAGGLEINETAKSLKVQTGQTITAGTFVDLTVVYNSGNNLSNISTQDSVLLTANKILSVYINTSNQQRQATIMTLSGLTLTAVGTPVTLPNFSGQNVNNVIKLIMLNENKAVLVYQNASTSNSGEAIILNITDNTITTTTPFIFQSGGGVQSLGATKIDENRVFVHWEWRSGDSYWSYSRVLRITGNTIDTPGAQLQMNFGFRGTRVSSFFIGNNNVVSMSSASSQLFGYFFTINSFTITKTTDTTFNLPSNTETVKSVLYDNTRVLVFHARSSTPSAQIGSLTISGTTLSWTNGTTVSSSAYWYQIGGIEKLSNSKIVIYYVDNPQGNIPYLRFYNITQPFSINTNSLERGVSSAGSCLTRVGDDQVLVGSSINTSVREEVQVVINTVNQKFDGLAKTGGTAGQTIEVYTNV
jgi:hypothetical protein